MKKPNSRRNLDLAITRITGQGQPFVAARGAIANAIVGQMLTGGVVKGGTSLKIRFGDSSTRATTDLDAARSVSLEKFMGDLEESLAAGWDDFTGRVVPMEPAKPKGVPQKYVMQPFQIKLSYNGTSWLTVDLEIGHDEIGDADEPEMRIPNEADAMLQAMGFPPLDPVPLMPLHHQIAQKLHGASEPNSKRAHDLIDLQVIMANAEINLPLVKRTCERLFAYRKMQPWPTPVVLGENWDTLYADQLLPLPVMQTAQEAVEWANALIESICNA